MDSEQQPESQADVSMAQPEDTRSIENYADGHEDVPEQEELEIEEDGEDDCADEEPEDVKINPACEEHSKTMYICDLLIGDVLICQALAGHKLQARSCAARKVCEELS